MLLQDECEESILRYCLFWKYYEFDNQMHAMSCIKNLLYLSLFGSSDTSITTQSILASSIPRAHAKKFLHDEYLTLTESQKLHVSDHRRLMGKQNFSSLRKTYNIIKTGDSLPRHNYTFRIDSNKICNSISFLQESLQVKPGCTRNVKVAGHLFSDIYLFI